MFSRDERMFARDERMFPQDERMFTQDERMFTQDERYWWISGLAAPAAGRNAIMKAAQSFMTLLKAKAPGC